MKKVDYYREKLRNLEDWEPFLLEESGLPGPRANLELAEAVWEEGNEDIFQHLLSFDAHEGPSDSPNEFLVFCGLVGLGRLLCEGRTEYLKVLRDYASDPRWRVREAVAIALQKFGEESMDALLAEMEHWSKGNPLEKRAAVAALCEPKLLSKEAQVLKVLQILDNVTASIADVQERKSEAFQALKKGLGYCWSVAAAALPEEGKKTMEKWFSNEDKDIRWIMEENLKKKRLAKMDAHWVEKWRERNQCARGVRFRPVPGGDGP